MDLLDLIEQKSMSRAEADIWRALYWRLGRDRAVKAPVLARETGFSEREIRQAVAGLINDHHLLIASSPNPNKGGYYVPLTAEEKRTAMSQLKSRAFALLRRARSLDKTIAREYLAEIQALLWEGE